MVNGWPELDGEEAVREDWEDTHRGGEEDGQPHVGLVQRVPGRSLKHTMLSRQPILYLLPHPLDFGHTFFW